MAFAAASLGAVASVDIDMSDAPSIQQLAATGIVAVATCAAGAGAGAAASSSAGADVKDLANGIREMCIDDDIETSVIAKQKPKQIADITAAIPKLAQRLVCGNTWSKDATDALTQLSALSRPAGMGLERWEQVIFDAFHASAHAILPCVIALIDRDQQLGHSLFLLINMASSKNPQHTCAMINAGTVDVCLRLLMRCFLRDGASGLTTDPELDTLMFLGNLIADHESVAVDIIKDGVMSKLLSHCMSPAVYSAMPPKARDVIVWFIRLLTFRINVREALAPSLNQLCLIAFLSETSPDAIHSLVVTLKQFLLNDTSEILHMTYIRTKGLMSKCDAIFTACDQGAMSDFTLSRVLELLAEISSADDRKPTQWLIDANIHIRALGYLKHKNELIRRSAAFLLSNISGGDVKQTKSVMDCGDATTQLVNVFNDKTSGPQLRHSAALTLASFGVASSCFMRIQGLVNAESLVKSRLVECVIKGADIKPRMNLYRSLSIMIEFTQQQHVVNPILVEMAAHKGFTAMRMAAKNPNTPADALPFINKIMSFVTPAIATMEFHRVA